MFLFLKVKIGSVYSLFCIWLFIFSHSNYNNHVLIVSMTESSVLGLSDSKMLICFDHSYFAGSTILDEVLEQSKDIQ